MTDNAAFHRDEVIPDHIKKIAFHVDSSANLKLEKCVKAALWSSVSQAHATNLPLDIQKQLPFLYGKECMQVSKLRIFYKEWGHTCVHCLVWDFYMCLSNLDSINISCSVLWVRRRILESWYSNLKSVCTCNCYYVCTCTIWLVFDIDMWQEMVKNKCEENRDLAMEGSHQKSEIKKTSVGLLYSIEDTPPGYSSFLYLQFVLII